MKYFLLIGVFALLTINGTLAFSEELVLSANSSMPEYNVGVYPTISGNVTNSQGDPISNIYVYALFPSKTVEAMTNSNGKFFLNPLTSYPLGEYTVDVYARSETVLSRISVGFEITEPSSNDKSDWLSENSLETTNSTSLLKNQTINFLTESENGTIGFVNEQRYLSKMNLQEDLLENSRELQKEKNRDAFASFVSTLDSIVHAIFWDQYDFTQKISDDAYDAKLGALEDGKTPQDAMKVYQDEAAVSRAEISEFMKELNIKHGFTNSTIQEQFDEQGKIPRNNQK